MMSSDDEPQDELPVQRVEGETRYSIHALAREKFIVKGIKGTVTRKPASHIEENIENRLTSTPNSSCVDFEMSWSVSSISQTDDEDLGEKSEENQTGELCDESDEWDTVEIETEANNLTRNVKHPCFWSSTTEEDVQGKALKPLLKRRNQNIIESEIPKHPALDTINKEYPISQNMQTSEKNLNILLENSIHNKSDIPPQNIESTQRRLSKKDKGLGGCKLKMPNEIPKSHQKKCIYIPYHPPTLNYADLETDCLAEIKRPPVKIVYRGPR